MVTINKIEDNKCDLYDGTGTLIGTIENMYSFNDICIQIKEQNLEGYFVIFEGYKISIGSDGRVYNKVNGFYDIISSQLRRLL